ncbi:Vacuolar protein sorting-associated protein 35 [Mortierella sp. GBA43]|nr:Vacuolar protein sorting-associated protein 35 [Mortierella sp. GBA43]
MTVSRQSTEDQSKALDDALAVVKVQAFQMKRCLDNSQLMDGLKYCSTMLSELRTSSLTPKNYYELYMAIFDALRHVSTYLKEAHQTEKHHLADLYELVQYAGNIVPRLYLMVTVGSVYMEIPDAPVKEIMRDMMEMTRGVQHPTRGLFLSPEGNITDSIQFILTNFIEMNKLWVRLQHQGHSKEREKREMERKELKILVGTNLVRLSQLDNVDLDVYQSTILPSILEQIVSCKDVIAQEYLMESVIQVFPDDFHLRTLGPLLSAAAQLHPKVNIKQIVISLVDRLAAHAAREAENNDDEEEEATEQPTLPKALPDAQDVADGDEAVGTEEKGEEKGDTEDAASSEPKAEELPEPLSKPPRIRKIRGIPEDVKLFEIFWGKIVDLVNFRPDLSIQDITALLVSLINLSLSCYPESLSYVDQVLGFAKEKMTEYADNPDLQHKDTASNLQSLLQSPIEHYTSILTLLELQNYASLLSLQPYQTRRAIAHGVVDSILKNETLISTPEEVNSILEICAVMIRDQKDGGHNSSPFRTTRTHRTESGSGIDVDEFVEEQGKLARIIHLFSNNDPDVQAAILSAARKQLGDGGERIRYLFPPLVTQAVKLTRRYKRLRDTDEGTARKSGTIFRFIHQIISILHNKVDNPEIVLRLFLLAGQSADECGYEDICYEFFVQALTVYEESISESRAQYQAIMSMVGTLKTTSCFTVDHYDTLITKCALHGAKLLKKPDQCRAVYACSHLWWGTITGQGEDSGEGPQSYQDGKRVLECLQRALKIADSCMDSVTNVELFVEILNRYIYYFEKQNESVTIKYLNGLIDLINTNLGNMDNPDQHPPSSNSSSLVENDPEHISEYVMTHFRNTLYHLERCKDSGDAKYADLDVANVVY